MQNDGESRGQALLALGLVKDALWPLFAFVCFVYFADPIKDILKSIPSIATSTQEINLNGFVLKLRDLPRPSPEIGSVLNNVNSRLLAALISASKNTGYCLNKNAPQPEDVYGQLKELGLMGEYPGSGDQCDVVRRLTDKGAAAQDYLINLIASQTSKK